MKILFSPSTIPAFNLAAEEYLFSAKKDDFLFLYVNVPCVIIGSNQAVLNEVDMDFCIRNDIRILRRLSGGGAVYHDEGNLNYCFISNSREGRSPLSADFLDPIVDVLSLLDIPAEIGRRKDLWLSQSFKISGTASHVSKGRELHHGTLLYDTDLAKLQNALSPEFKNLNKKATASVPSPVRNIRNYLSEKGQEAFLATDFFTLFAQKMQEYYQTSAFIALSDEDIAEIEALRKGKYTQRVWNYRM